MEGDGRMRRHRVLPFFFVLFLLAGCCVANEVPEGEVLGFSEIERTALDNFLNWFTTNGGSSHKISIVKFAEYGRGIVAEDDIREGEVILSVPQGLVMTTPTHPSTRDSFLDQLFKEEPQSATHEAAISLLYYKHTPTSFFAPYVAVLPSKIDTTNYFTDKEIAALEGSKIHAFAVARRGHIEGQYPIVFKPLFERYPEVFKPDVYTFEEFKWALTLLWSRSFIVMADGEPRGAIVPFACMFNTQVNATYLKVRAVTRDDGKIDYVTTDPIAKGEQIFMQYGSSHLLSNGQLLMDYGFVIEDNPADFVGIHFPLIAKEIISNYDEKYQFLTDANLPSIDTFPIHISHIEESLFHILRILRVIYATQGELADAFEQFNQGEVVNKRNEKVVLRNFETQVKKVLAEYPTTIEEDEELLTTKLTKNMRGAVILRLTEKRILSDMHTMLTSLRDTLSELKWEKKKKKPSAPRGKGRKKHH